MEISFHYHLDSTNTVIATKVCTWHDSCALVTCATICCDLMASNKAKFSIEFELRAKTVSETGPWNKMTTSEHMISDIGYSNVQYFARFALTGFNSFWPSNPIWRHTTGLTQARVMACFFTAPSHYLKQCWLPESAQRFSLSFSWVQFRKNCSWT